jgi:hypothetical protein
MEKTTMINITLLYGVAAAFSYSKAVTLTIVTRPGNIQ